MTAPDIAPRIHGGVPLLALALLVGLLGGRAQAGGVVVATIPMSPQPRGMTTGADGHVWVGLPFSANVERIDPATNSVIAVVSIDDTPTFSQSIDLTTGADGHIWVSHNILSIVSRIDPATNTVIASIPFPLGVQGLTTGADGHIWAASSVLSRIDPAINAVVATVAVDAAPLGLTTGADGHIWASNVRFLSTELVRVDPATNTVIAAVPVPDLSINLTTGADGHIWSGPGPGVVTRVDPATNGIVGSVSVSGSGGIASGLDGSIWVAVGDGGLQRIDPGSETVVETVTTPFESEGLTIGLDGDVWISDFDDSNVMRVELQAVLAVDVAAPATVTAGTPLDVTISVSNDDPLDGAEDVVVSGLPSLALEPGATLAFASGAGTWSCAGLECTASEALPPGASAAFTLSGVVAAETPASTISNGATATWSNPESSSASGSADTGVDAAECFLVIGDGPGDATFLDIGHLFQTQLDVVKGSYAVLMDDIPEFVLPTLAAATAAQGIQGTRRSKQTPPPEWLLDGQLTVQILMWNPQVFPGQPEQYSAGLAVQILPNGQVVSTPYGSAQGGIDVWAEVDTNAQGQKVLRFPFSIEGL